MCSDPACTLPPSNPAHTHRGSPQRPPHSSPLPGYPSACLQITPPVSLPSPPWQDISYFSVLWKNSLHNPSWPISASSTFLHVAAPSLWESSPAGAHYRRAWSWLSVSRLICCIPLPLPAAEPSRLGVLLYVGGWGRAVCSGERHKTFFCGLCLLLSCFLTVALVGKEGQRRVTCWERFHVVFVMSPLLFTVIHAVLFMAMYCAVK